METKEYSNQSTKRNVTLSEMLKALECIDINNATGYYHIPSGEIRYLADPKRNQYDEAMEKLAADIKENASDYLRLPLQKDIHKRMIKERFVSNMPAGRTQLLVEHDLFSRGGARRFHETVKTHGVETEWQAFRDTDYMWIASDWCKANDVGLER